MSKLARIREHMFGDVLAMHDHRGIVQPDIKWYRVKLRVVRRVIYDGVRFPRRFGLAYIDWETDTKIMYLLPFNFIVAICRHIYFFLAWNVSAAFRKRQQNWIYRVGYDNGYKDGYGQRSHE